MASSTKMVPVRGNTYPVKDKLGRLGARWSAADKCWMVPESKLSQALALVGSSARSGDASVGRAEADYSCFRPTGEQGALLAFLQASDRNLFVEAGAGCGKTTTALWLLFHLRGRKCMVAFNRDIKKDIEEKAPRGVEVLTMNALGFRALTAAYNVRALKVDSDYTFTIFKQIYGETAVGDDYKFFANVAKLYDLARGALAQTTEDLEILAAEYEVNFVTMSVSEGAADGASLPADVDARDWALESDAMDATGPDATEAPAGIVVTDRTSEAVALVLSIMSDRARGTHCPEGIDFTDQMWLPVVRGLSMPQFDVLVIDEAQDTNALQVEMLARCAASGARVITVGDRRQAIYRFRGADSRAVDAIVERFDMRVLPLMTTFRCGTAIVAEAQRIVPQFQAGPNNKPGLVRSIEASKLPYEAKPGDFVISRSNAPLISGCIAALAANVRATIVGRDVGEDLLRLAKRMKAKTMEEFYFRLEAWKISETEKQARKVPVRESAIEAIADKAACLEAIAESVKTVQALYARCETLFSDASNEPRIEFTSTHKAKGRERGRVFLLRDTFCKARLNRQTGEWVEPSEEEFNLLYVAITRAKDELVYVTSPKGRS